MRKLFYLLIATLVLVSCGNGSKKKTGENQAEEIQSNRIEVLYFHGAVYHLPGDRSKYSSPFG